MDKSACETIMKSAMLERVEKNASGFKVFLENMTVFLLISC